MIRYHTRCYFNVNVRSKADMSQLNLPRCTVMEERPHTQDQDHRPPRSGLEAPEDHEQKRRTGADGRLNDSEPHD